MQSTGGVGGVDRVVGSTKTLKLQLKTFKVECDFVPPGHTWAGHLVCSYFSHLIIAHQGLTSTWTRIS